ncbi:hypothetical protein [Streptomyces sp. FIT100]|uniref:hypothetical protein n=1 Tax=Streptomyces sp. FIT100 TaxID=2837956 RepID=UPI0021C8F7A4|nr:hypothetical protein [Streptomyces sp. FIT100]UUN29489.1 hypothetical protein KK483_26270 [Streptomyces sp. FIT100]
MFEAGYRRIRRRTAAVALAAAVLTATAGCGDGDPPAADDKPGASTTGTGAPAPGALTEGQLTARSFTEGEKVGRYTASEYTLGAPLGEEYTADPVVCQPLVSLARGATAYAPSAEVHRKVDVPEEMTGTTVAVTLRSYSTKDAAAVMKALDTAGKECAAGFTEVRAIAKATYLTVEPVKAPAVGGEADEAKAFRFTVLDVKGKLKLYEYLTVLRSGSTTLSFRGEITGTKDIGGVPQEVITAQWEKFSAGDTGAAEGAGA